ncbi:MAG TPA: hypothetical protein ENJ00_07985 [Phycisphaerales bacterium]|nr:hypothetical protein [Phycisphaerales bacterium]
MTASQTYDGLIALVNIPAVDQLDAAEQRRFSASHTNAARDLPLQYGAFNWSPDQASAIAQASRQKSACESRGESIDSETASTLSWADANADVAVASQSIEARLESIRNIWDSGVGFRN